jgi:hypothetical protein
MKCHDTHVSTFWRNLLPPFSLSSTLEMEDVGFSKKVDIIHIPENSHVNTHATRTEYLT